MENLGEKISSLRKQNNMTQRELAAELHVSDKVVSKWELGLSEPDISTIKQLASVFNTTVARLLDETETKTAKLDLNTRLYNFFKRNYMTIIQLILIYAAVIAACAGYGYLCGYDLVVDILPDYALGILLCFSIVIGILHGIVVLVDRGHISVTILKAALLATYAAMLMASFILLSMVNNEFYRILCSVSGVVYSILFIAGVLTLLVDIKVINTKAPLKLGKILFVLVLAFLGTCSALVVGDIATISVSVSQRVYKEETPYGLRFSHETYRLYEVGDKLQTYMFFPSGTRNEKVSYSSTNTKVAVISEQGIIEAKSYGHCTIYAKTKSGVNVSCKVEVVEPSFEANYDSYSEVLPEYCYYSVYANTPKSISLTLNNADKYNDIENRFTFYLEDGVEFSSFELNRVGDVFNIDFQIDSILKITRKELYLCIKDKYNSATYVQRIKLDFQDVTSMYISNVVMHVGETLEIRCTINGNANTKLTYSISNPNIVEIVDENKLYAKAKGEFVITATAQNGITTSQEITIL